MKCKSCGIDLVDHIGHQGLCNLYQEALERIEKIETACRENLSDKCTCFEEYTTRGMIDPECSFCNYSKYIFEALRNLK